MMNLYGYICDICIIQQKTVITWVDWKAEDAFSVPCCAECGSMEHTRHVTTVKINPNTVNHEK